MIVKAGNETVYDSNSARKSLHAVTRIWNPLRFWTVTDSFRHFLSYPPYPRSKGLTVFWAGLLTYLLIPEPSRPSRSVAFIAIMGLMLIRNHYLRNTAAGLSGILTRVPY